MMRWPALIGALIFSLLLAMPVAVSARQRLNLPAIKVIVPAGLVSGKESRDILYDRVINFMLARYPECSRLKASLTFTPQRTTAVLSVRCLGMGRTAI